MSFAYMRLYTGDFRKTTARLSIVARGIYVEFLMECWDSQGGLPTDEKELKRICGARTKGEVREMWHVLRSYFVEETAQFICQRMQKEIDHAQHVSAARMASGAKGGLAKSVPGLAIAPAIGKQLHTSSASASVTSTSKTKTDSKPFAPTDEKLSLGADGKWHGVSEERLAVWHAAFPAVDLQAEMAKAAAWVLSNPQHKKSNYARFLNTWFAKAQDRACQPPRYPTQPSAAERRDADHHRRLQVLRVLPPDQPVAPAMHFANPFDDAFTLEDDHARLIDGSKH